MAGEYDPNLLDLTDTMGFIAFNQSLPVRERLARLHCVAEYAGERLATAGEPACEGDYLASLEMRTWLACLPSLEAIAGGQPHNADISEEVLGNLMPVLTEAVAGASEGIKSFRTTPSVQGFIAEIAVLGTLLWSHSNMFERVRRYALPASHGQDKSTGKGRRSGFDVLLDKQDLFVPLQVKSNDKSTKKRAQMGFYGHGYRKDVAVVYVSRLVDQDRDPNYAPLHLADAVIRGIDDELYLATEGIDTAVKEALPFLKEARSLYAA